MARRRDEVEARQVQMDGNHHCSTTRSSLEASIEICFARSRMQRVAGSALQTLLYDQVQVGTSGMAKVGGPTAERGMHSQPASAMVTGGLLGICIT